MGSRDFPIDISMNNNKVMKAMEDMEFVFNSGKAGLFGFRLMNNKRFVEAYKSTIKNLEDTLVESQHIMENKETILEDARNQARKIIQEAEIFVQNMDSVKEAEIVAQNIISAANDEAKEIREEAENISENAIEYGENTKNKLIHQGQKFLSEQFEGSLVGIEETIKKLQASQTVLEDSCEEINSFFEDKKNQTKVS